MNLTEQLDALTEQRFWEKVDKTASCWLWTGAVMSTGYGSMNIKRKTTRVHRLSYLMHNGPIPVGLQVPHACDNPLCVNPSHLSVGTNAENAADMCAKGRHACAKKTHCPHGHPYDEANTYRYPDGKRSCRTCRRSQSRRYKQRMRVLAVLDGE